MNIGETKAFPRTYQRLLYTLTIFAVVIFSSVVLEITLDMAGLGKTKQSIGILGVLFIATSFLYSARKHYFKWGSIKKWLKFHEVMTVSGAILIFIHTGWHVHAVIPQLALILMVITVLSGFIGAYMYQLSRRELKEQEKKLQQSDRLSKEEIENQLAFLASASKLMGKWRKIHIPIVELLFSLTIIHIISAVYFSGRIW